jgi:hypothetical protein
VKPKSSIELSDTNKTVWGRTGHFWKTKGVSIILSMITGGVLASQVLWPFWILIPVVVLIAYVQSSITHHIGYLFWRRKQKKEAVRINASFATPHAPNQHTPPDNSDLDELLDEAARGASNAGKSSSP